MSKGWHQVQIGPENDETFTTLGPQAYLIAGRPFAFFIKNNPPAPAAQTAIIAPP